MSLITLKSPEMPQDMSSSAFSPPTSATTWKNKRKGLCPTKNYRKRKERLALQRCNSFTDEPMPSSTSSSSSFSYSSPFDLPLERLQVLTLPVWSRSRKTLKQYRSWSPPPCSRPSFPVHYSDMSVNANYSPTKDHDILQTQSLDYDQRSLDVLPLQEHSEHASTSRSGGDLTREAGSQTGRPDALERRTSSTTRQHVRFASVLAIPARRPCTPIDADLPHITFDLSSEDHENTTGPDRDSFENKSLLDLHFIKFSIAKSGLIMVGFYGVAAYIVSLIAACLIQFLPTWLHSQQFGRLPPSELHDVPQSRRSRRRSRSRHTIDGEIFPRSAPQSTAPALLECAETQLPPATILERLPTTSTSGSDESRSAKSDTSDSSTRIVTPNSGLECLDIEAGESFAPPPDRQSRSQEEHIQGKISWYQDESDVSDKSLLQPLHVKGPARTSKWNIMHIRRKSR